MKIKIEYVEVPSSHERLCANAKEYTKFLNIQKDSHTSLGFTLD